MSPAQKKKKEEAISKMLKEKESNKYDPQMSRLTISRELTL